jgi:hypothetical protein
MEGRTTRQKAGEIESFRSLEIGETKWWKEHIPHKGNDLNDITEEGISLLDDTELWWEKQDLLWSCHVSRTKDRVNNDGSFWLQQNGAISSTYTSDWDLQVNTHSFPSNYWRHEITKGKESNRCDLSVYRTLWMDSTPHLFLKRDKKKTRYIFLFAWERLLHDRLSS